MQKQKENQFLDKFRLLNSQEHTEEIVWSQSDSSEYEEPTNRTRILKRKRKKKATNNISNLSISVLDASKCSSELQCGETSPILVNKKLQSVLLSPILASTYRQHPLSPVLPCRSVSEKSPILAPKSSPRIIGKIKKKLFNQKGYDEDTNNTNFKTELDRNHTLDNTCRTEENTSKAKSELANKVKSFFDNHFSSECSSQNSQSISDIQTQRNSTKTSDEVEILTCETQTGSSNSLIKPIKQENSDQSSENTYYALSKCKKKIRYKKDGLAYRLSTLLRKQNACLSLWHHERFLAANSNFIVPKGEYTVFRIKKVHFKYGCYLLDVVDLNDDEYLVLINSCYVSESILCDTIIKVYVPFKEMQLNITKLLINVTRFECSPYQA